LDEVHNDGYFIHDSKIIAEATARTKEFWMHIIKQLIDKIMSNCLNLNSEQKQQLKNLLEESYEY